MTGLLYREWQRAQDYPATSFMQAVLIVALLVEGIK